METKKMIGKGKAALKMYSLFGVWYFMGSIVSTFLTGTLVVKIQAGLTKEQLGSLMAIAGLPWVVKPIWGFVIDRFKSLFWWAMVASAAVALSVLGLVTVENSTPYWLIVVVVLLPNFLRSLQDVAVDGLSIAISREEQRGAVQTWMRVGTIAGSLLGGAGAMYLQASMSWASVCLVLVAVSIVTGFIVPLALNGKQAHESSSAAKASWKDFTGMIKSPVILFGLLLAVFSVPAQQITYPVFFQWWSSGHYGKDMIPVIFLWAPLFQFVGAVLGGMLVRGTENKALAVIVATPVIALTYLVVGMSSHWSQGAVMGLSWATALVDTIYAVALFALLMDLTDRRFTALSFALFMAGFNLCGVWANWLGGQLSGSGVSVAEIFMFAGIAQLCVIPLVMRIEKLRGALAKS